MPAPFVLAQVDAAAPEVDIFAANPPPVVSPGQGTQVPPGQHALIEKIVVCNRVNSGSTFRISLTINGAVTTDKDWLYYDAPIGGKATLIIELNVTMQGRDTLRGSSAGNVTFTVIGQRT